MTGFGSPCGACKFLRRKCVRGCVFAPYFCHEQSCHNFAAIHKVFGASNVSKLLMHLPVSDRREAAVTIAYEAQARLQDPIYGCVSHIFALQQQVVNLEAQLASLRAQAAQGFANGSTSTSTPQEDKLYSKFLTYQQDEQGLFQNGHTEMAQQLYVSNPQVNAETLLYTDNALPNSNFLEDYKPYSDMPDDHSSIAIDESSLRAIASLDEQANTMRPAYHDLEDLQSVAFGYLHRA